MQWVPQSQGLNTSRKKAHALHPPLQRGRPCLLLPPSRKCSMQTLVLSTFISLWDRAVHFCQKERTLWEQNKATSRVTSVSLIYRSVVGVWYFLNARCTSYVGASKHPLPNHEGLLLSIGWGFPSLRQPGNSKLSFGTSLKSYFLPRFLVYFSPQHCHLSNDIWSLICLFNDHLDRTFHMVSWLKSSLEIAGHNTSTITKYLR